MRAVLLSFTLVAGSVAGQEPVAIRARALCIGINVVDKAKYEGHKNDLKGAEADAKAMQDFVTSRGFAKSEPLIGSQAIRGSVIRRLRELSREAVDGDTVVIFFAGHGAQIADQSGDEGDGRDEAWCLYDGMLRDDLLLEELSSFKNGVDVILVSDSCYSGSQTRGVLSLLDLNEFGAGADYANVKLSRVDGYPKMAVTTGALFGVRRMLDDVADKVVKKDGESHLDSRKTEEQLEDALQASIIFLSACQDNQLATEFGGRGMFTIALLEAAETSRNYRHLHAAVVERMPSHQSPNYMALGANPRRLERSKPFSPRIQ